MGKRELFVLGFMRFVFWGVGVRLSVVLRVGVEGGG